MRICKIRHVSLTPELEALVDCKVVRAAVRLLDEREQRMDREPKPTRGATGAR